MFCYTLRHFSLKRTYLALLIAGGLSLSACAALPHFGKLPQQKPVSSYATEKSFAAAKNTSSTQAKTPWPKDKWWEAYGDPQLNTLIEEALKGSPAMPAAEARFVHAKAVAQGAGAALLPELGANASAQQVKQSYNNGIPPDFVPHGWKDAGEGALNFSYAIDFWGRNRAALAAAISEKEAARAEAAEARLALSSGVAASYADLAQLYADRDAAEGAAKIRGKTAQLMKKRYDNGLEMRGSWRQAEAERASAEAELLALDEAISLNKNRIAALLGAGPDRGLAITRPKADVIRNAGDKSLSEHLSLELIGRRPDITASRLRAEAAAKRIKVAKADFYPNVNLTAIIGYQSLGLDMLAKSGSLMGNVGPAVNLPIFSGGRLQGAYRGARADYARAVAEYDQTLTEALHEVANSITSKKALAGRLAKAEEAYKDAEEAYQLSIERYKGGLSTYITVLTTENTLIVSRKALADMKARAFTLDVALIRALGGGFKEKAGTIKK